MTIRLRSLLLPLVGCFFLARALMATSPAFAEKGVLEAMRKATDFMMNKVSNRGGFLWYYSADLTNQWGKYQL